MKKIKCSLGLICLSLISTAAFSQSAPAPNLSGIIINSHGFSAMDIQQFSQSYRFYGTARSAAMGGAFTSLGGDLMSVGLNPAGLGMYRGSAWGFSTALTTSNTTNAYSTLNNNTTRFSLNNIGMVLNLFDNSRGVLSFNLGYTYNKTADFNFRTSASLGDGASTINDIFVMQLNGLNDFVFGNGWGNPIRVSDLNRDFFANAYLDDWGAGLSFLTGGTGQAVNGVDSFLIPLMTDYVNIAPSLNYSSRGSIGEHNISGGMNIGNFLYLGFGLGLQDIYQKQWIDYTENYNYTNVPNGYLRSMNYNQTVTMNGSGVNFKVGAVVRPIPELRIGVAVHTPSFMSLAHTYIADMGTSKYGGGSSDAVSYTNNVDYQFRTPARLLTGVSYTFFNVAAVSVDYEKVFYRGMRFRSDDPWANDDYRASIEETYRNSDNVMLGVEIKPIPQFAFRFGAFYYGSPLTDFENGDERIVSRFAVTDSYGISAGLGFRLGRKTTLDLAYIYSKSNYAGLDLFFYEGEGVTVDDQTGAIVQDVIYRQNPESGERPAISPVDYVRDITQGRHTITASFNFMF